LLVETESCFSARDEMFHIVSGGLKRIARRLADASGAFAVSRQLTAHLPRILMYHQFTESSATPAGGVSASVLRQQLGHITRRYRPVRLQDLARARVAGEPMPPRSVVITIDDGHTSFLRWAFPVLKEFGIPTTLFIVSDLLDTGRWLWTDRFMYLQAHARAVIPDAILTALKQLPPPERDHRLEELARQAGVTIPSLPPEPYALLSRVEVQQLAQSGLVEIGSHTRTHATLCSLDSEQSWIEVAGSRRDLERSLDLPITALCFPNGQFGDYRPEHVTMAARAGYLCATASHFGCVTGESDRFALPRIGGDAADMTTFRKYVDGFEYLQRRINGDRCW
jgi:peptidoglycan/xylan/chitin deacetylase (PgdA/CDA1 family)